MEVKICGITNVGDAVDALSLGADMIGQIIEVPVDTPRKVDLGDAATVRDAVADHGGDYVAVIMPETLEDIDKVVGSLSPDMVQLHGVESPMLSGSVKKKYGSLKLIKALHIDSGFDMSYARASALHADFILTDTKASGKIGGTGQTHDLHYDLMVKDEVDRPIFLSGGLNPSNVKERAEILTPYAVDVSSGVEASPGKKDIKLVKDFIEEVASIG